MIETIFIFAAGLGSRMRPLTENLPKPLIKVNSKPLLQYNLELVLQFPFKRIIINTHYLSSQIVGFVDQFRESKENLPEIITIHEPILLETGGAIKNAIRQRKLSEKPIFTMNSDMIIGTNKNIFELMLAKWNSRDMDFLLLLQDCSNALGYHGAGDFNLSDDDQLLSSKNIAQYSYIYGGVSIIKPSIIKDNPQTIFSLKDYYLTSDKAHGITIHGSKWYHASSPEDIPVIEQYLR